MYAMFARSQSSHVIPSISLTTVLLLSLVIGGCVRAKSPILYPSASLNQRGNEQDGRDLEERGGPLPKGGESHALVNDPGPLSKRENPPPHIRAVQAFLLAWGKERWDEARAVAAERVRVMLGGKVFLLDLTARKTDVAVVFPFRGISTFRMKGEVKGVTLVEIGLKAGEIKQRGRGTVTLEEKNGEYRVTAVAVE